MNTITVTRRVPQGVTRRDKSANLTDRAKYKRSLVLRSFRQLSRSYLASAFSSEPRAMRTMVARDNRLHLLFFRGEGMMAGPYIQLEKELD